MTFEQTKKKMEMENLLYWRLSSISPRGQEQFFSQFNEEGKSIKESIKYLESQVKFRTEEFTKEVEFLIRARQKLTGNGPYAEITWEFTVPKKGNEQQAPGLNGQPGGNMGYPGLGMLENNYVQRELEDMRRLKDKYETKLEDFSEKRNQMLIERNNLDRDKEAWAKEKENDRKAWEEIKNKLEKEHADMKLIYNDNVAAGKEAIAHYMNKGIFPLIKDIDSRLSGPPADEAPKDAKDQIIESFATAISAQRHELTEDELQAIGVHCHVMVKKFIAERQKQQHKEKEEAAA